MTKTLIFLWINNTFCIKHCFSRCLEFHTSLKSSFWGQYFFQKTQTALGILLKLPVSMFFRVTLLTVSAGARRYIYITGPALGSSQVAEGAIYSPGSPRSKQEKYRMGNGFLHSNMTDCSFSPQRQASIVPPVQIVFAVKLKSWKRLWTKSAKPSLQIVCVI